VRKGPAEKGQQGRSDRRRGAGSIIRAMMQVAVWCQRAAHRGVPGEMSGLSSGNNKRADLLLKKVYAALHLAQAVYHPYGLVATVVPPASESLPVSSPVDQSLLSVLLIS